MKILEADGGTRLIACFSAVRTAAWSFQSMQHHATQVVMMTFKDLDFLSKRIPQGFNCIGWYDQAAVSI